MCGVAKNHPKHMPTSNPNKATVTANNILILQWAMTEAFLNVHGGNLCEKQETIFNKT